MCSSFTGEEVGKDKAFTHKSQHVKRIEGRGEGKKRKVAECAMRERVRRRECAYTRERAGRVSEAGRTERERREGHRAKERGRALKKRGLGGETREEGKESPQVFDH